MKKKSTRGRPARLRGMMNGRRSKLEERCEEILKAKTTIEYEPERLPFTQPAVQRHYIPDFRLANGSYIEIKGRLTLEDRKKMLLVKEQHPDKIFRFIFGNGNNKLTKKSPTTYLEWATKNGFEAIDESMPIPEEWYI